MSYEHYCFTVNHFFYTCYPVKKVQACLFFRNVYIRTCIQVFLLTNKPPQEMKKPLSLSLYLFYLLPAILFLGACNSKVKEAAKPEATLLKGATLIDGSGAAPKENVNILIRADSIAKISPDSTNATSTNATVINMQGKTIMPMLINAHGHLGLLKGTKIDTAHYTKGNIIRQLEKYQNFGIGAVLSLGSDRGIIFNLRDSSQQHDLPGAMILTAGYGFGAPDGAPPVNGDFDKVLRPETPEQATNDMRTLAAHKPDFVKIWVDDFGGSAPKVKPEIYQAIIAEAHRSNIPVAAHVYYLEDAKKLIAAGLDVIAHSIRDQPVDDELLQMMKENEVAYIPTLSLDAYNFIYLRKPDWLDDPFFYASLEPGVLKMLTSEDYLQKIERDPKLQEKIKAFETASQNLKRIYDAGIRIAMGTDSGAQPVRAQGFSEHIELQLMHEAGIPPLQAIAMATSHGAQALGIANIFGTLSEGKKANFIVLNSNPADDMKNTRDIAEIWKNGEIISKGPVK